MEQYLNLLKRIKKEGTYKPAARENMPGTQSLFGHQFRHDLSKGFPLLTTKKIYWKGVVAELLWFLNGDTNIKFLIDNGVNIWNEDAFNYYCKKCKEHGSEQKFTFETFVEWLKGDNYPVGWTGDKYKLGDCGFQYGKVWRKWEGNHKEDHTENEMIDQVKNVLNALKKSPESRRHIITAIDPANDTDLALYWCHAMFQFNCRPLTILERSHYAVNNNIMHRNELMFDSEDTGLSLEEQLNESDVPKYYLDCQLYQRSADVVLGVPFNIASYALLIEIFSKITNMIPGDFVHTFGDVHIYDNHKDAVEEQLLRTPTELPTLKMTEDPNDWGFVSSFYDFSALTVDDFKLENYNPQPAIKAELSTGLKK